MTKININGKFFDEDQALISVKDRGFRFGDGIFDTIKVINSKPVFFPLHMERIIEGLDSIRIDLSTKNIEQQIYQTIKTNNLKNGYVRISITRGEGSRGYMPTDEVRPNFVIETMKDRRITQTDGSLYVSQYQKPSLKSLPVNSKLMQGLNSTLAKMEANDTGCFDAILLNHNMQICECSSSNIFWFDQHDNLRTPSRDSGCLNGVTRKIIIENFETHEGFYGINSLKTANEVFITNTVIGVFPIYEIKGYFENFNKDYVQTQKVIEMYRSKIND